MSVLANHYANTYKPDGTLSSAIITTHFTRRAMLEEYAAWVRECMSRGNFTVSVYEGEDVVIREVSYE